MISEPHFSDHIPKDDEASAVNATSAFTFNNNRGNDCGPCQRMLHQVLQQAQSRPRDLLASMQASFLSSKTTPSSSPTSSPASTLQWRTTDEGNIQVQIPTEASMPPVPLQERTWMRIQPPMIVSPSKDPQHSSRPAFTTGSRLFSATSSLRFHQEDKDEDISQQSVSQNQQQQQQQQRQQQSDPQSHPAKVVSTSIASRLSLPMVGQSTTKQQQASDANNTRTPSSPQTQQHKATSATTASSTNVASTTNTPQKLTEWMNISCQVCPNTGPKGNARAFVNGPEPLDIVVCSNRLRHTPGTPAALREMEEILTHEMVHVYDARQTLLDLRQCENLAYSEVRAAREAECRFATPSLFRPSLSACVRERAQTATENLFPTTARQCVQRVFDTALKDERPFAVNETTTRSSQSPTTNVHSPRTSMASTEGGPIHASQR